MASSLQPFTAHAHMPSNLRTQGSKELPLASFRIGQTSSQKTERDDKAEKPKEDSAPHEPAS